MQLASQSEESDLGGLARGPACSVVRYFRDTGSLLDPDEWYVAIKVYHVVDRFERFGGYLVSLQY